MSVEDSQYSTQDSMASEDLPTEEEEEFDDYPSDSYDPDIVSMDGEGEARDVSFQRDPEYFEFSCLSIEETWNFLDSQARDISEELKVDVPASRAMLHALNWDSKELVERYSQDRQTLLIDAQLRPNKPEKRLKLRDSCPVCLTPQLQCKMFGLVCGHTFCSLCWAEYLTSRIHSGNASEIECMECSVRVSLEVVESLMQSSAELYAKYLRFALAEFVQVRGITAAIHSLLRWCPGADCSVVFHVREPLAKQVVCPKCHNNCCFRCGEAYHCPTDCDTIRKWITKCHDDSETANYFMANTKDCPNCHTAIEKSGGCNHMSCSKCRCDFCWMCLKPWKSHSGYYNCSKYEEDGEPTEVNKARKALEKYLFYYQRWANHDQSLRLEETTKRRIQNRIEAKVTAGSGTWIDWQYLIDAASLLRKCRYTLKYTYPYAYFLEGDKKPLFEYQQAQLEVEIENLSWKVERAETTDVGDLRQQMNVAEVKRLTLLRDFVP